MPKYLSIARKYTGTLRPYQHDGVAEVRKSLASGPTLLVSPTGAGKTDMAAAIAEAGYRSVLFVGHRRELLAQALKKVGLHVVCLSIQRALRDGPKKVDLLIIDEAHRASAKTYRMLIEKYSIASRLGLTATPLRTDGQGLCDAFSYMVQVSSVKELVENNWLVPTLLPLGPSVEALAHLARLKKLKRRGKDYDPTALAKVVNTPRLVGQVVTEYLLHAKGRKAIVFAVNVAHSKTLEAEFKKHNVRAIHIDGKASVRVRDAALQQLANGEIEVLCNVNLFTEGWDCPSVSCVIMARPTMSLTLHLQCLGRGMRPDPGSGKKNLLIIDHAGNVARHGMPDEDREWWLESRGQREDREKRDAAENEARDLGFGSLTQYRLEQARLVRESYPAPVVARMLGIPSKKVSVFLSFRGISRQCGSSISVRYPKDAIDALVEIRTNSYTAAQCREILSTKNLVTYLRRHAPQLETRERNFYPKDEIDKLAKRVTLYADNYTASQVQPILEIKAISYVSTFLNRRGIDAIPGIYPPLYPKSDVDKLAAELRVNRCFDSYTPAEAAEILRTPAPTVSVYLQQYGIRPVSTGSKRSTNGTQYPKDQVDALARSFQFNETYSISEVTAKLGTRWNDSAAAMLKRRGIDPIVRVQPRSGFARRFLRSEVDALFRNGKLKTRVPTVAKSNFTEAH